MLDQNYFDEYYIIMVYWLVLNYQKFQCFRRRTRRKVGYPSYWGGCKQPKMKTQINAAAIAGANAIRA